MSLTYEPLAARRHRFDVNVAGATLIGIVHRAAGLPSTRRPPRVPYEATGREARAWAIKLRAWLHGRGAELPPEAIACCESGRIARDLVESWLRFLTSCGGYNAS
jgi:hypothetical protein